MTTEPYFCRGDSANVYVGTTITGGSWYQGQMHIAPLIGLMGHVAEHFQLERGKEFLQLARFTVEIFGIIPNGEIAVAARVLRAGRTIELIEVSVREPNGDRVLAQARAWYSGRYDTQVLQERDSEPRISSLNECQPMNFIQREPGAFVPTVEAVRRQFSADRSDLWVRTLHPLLESDEGSPIVRMLAVIDVANGANTVMNAADDMFPNIELSVHLLRPPVSAWLGMAVQTSVGPTGLGLNRTDLFDEYGRVGVMAQSLTVRPAGQ